MRKLLFALLALTFLTSTANAQSGKKKPPEAATRTQVDILQGIFEKGLYDVKTETAQGFAGVNARLDKQGEDIRYIKVEHGKKLDDILTGQVTTAKFMKSTADNQIASLGRIEKHLEKAPNITINNAPTGGPAAASASAAAASSSASASASTAAASASTAPTPTVVEKIVYVEKPVEKIVYRDVEKIVYVDRVVVRREYVDRYPVVVTYYPGCRPYYDCYGRFLGYGS